MNGLSSRVSVIPEESQKPVVPGKSEDVILQVSGLGKRYGEAVAVRDVNFSIRHGEVLTLLGQSGCGKSTTLRMIAGLETPDAGEIRMKGSAVAATSRGFFLPAEKRNIGMVFQSYAIWPHMTVSQNVGYPLQIRRWPKKKRMQKVEEVLQLVGLSGFADRPATMLSGGQQQRVALARAIAYEPDILLLDEPLSNLDAKLRPELLSHIRDLQKRIHTTILYVTHDQTEAMSLSTHIAVMKDGVIQQYGTPSEIYEEPSNYFVQQFVGSVLTMDGVMEADQHGSRVYLPGDVPGQLPATGPHLAAGSQVKVTVRPEDIIPQLERKHMNDLPAMVQDFVYLGNSIEYLLQVGSNWVRLAVHKGWDWREGDMIYLQLQKYKIWEMPV